MKYRPWHDRAIDVLVFTMDLIGLVLLPVFVVLGLPVLAIAKVRRWD